MKKIIVILGVFTIAITLFFSTTNNSVNIDLASLASMNTANAESNNGMAACDCSWGWGPNDGCKVSNWGFQCASNGETNCNVGENNCA